MNAYLTADNRMNYNTRILNRVSNQQQSGLIILISLVAPTDVPPSCTANPSTTVGFQTPTEGHPTVQYMTPIGSAWLNHFLNF